MMHRMLARRLAQVMAWLAVAIAAACQPATLAQEEVNGTVTTGAADAVLGDVAAAQDAKVDVQAGTDTVVPGDGCKVDQDCAAKAATCQIGSCNAGKCVFANKPPTAACDDGDPCSIGDACDSGGTCVKGPKGADCDDKNDCTVDNCEAKVGCVHAPKNNGACDDKNPCTVAETCSAGVCNGGTKTCECEQDVDCPQNNICLGPQVCDKGKMPYTCKPTSATPKCPDDDPGDCMDVKCDPSDLANPCKSVPKKENAACDDGIPCTLAEKCVGGKCTFATNTCECLDDQKCFSQGTFNQLCTGKLYCDTKGGYVCKKAPAVVCDKSADTVCAQNTCDITDGKCKMTPVNKPKIPCDDYNPCTVGDVCAYANGNYSGQCVPGKAVACQCATDDDCAAQEDGDLCNGTLFCNQVTGQCQLNPASVKVCPTALDSVCLKTLCNKKTGICESVPTERLKSECPADKPGCGILVKLPDDASPASIACDDGNPCTGTSFCKGGQCYTEKSSFVCSCLQNSDCAQLGDKCSGTFICNKISGKCELNPATVKVCPTVGDTQCAHNICDKATGACVMTPLDNGTDYVPCEDGNPCTVFDGCQNGQCVSGNTTCLCTKDDDCKKWDDDNPCTGTMYCNKVSLKCEINPTTVVLCSSAFDTPCQENMCKKTTGKCEMVTKNNLTPCDDGNPCTLGDTCMQGDCVGSPPQCDCTSTADCGSQEDGDVCNGTLYCDTSKLPFKCKVNPTTVVVCPSAQDTVCVQNTCDKLTGKCSMKPNPKLYASCDDGNDCTVGDVCVAGVCKSGSNLCQCTLDGDCAQYDDGNDCNGKLACLGDSGAKLCGINPVSVITCAGGTECSKNTCDAATSKCKIVPVPEACNDNNPCTVDACDGAKCTHTAYPDATQCSLGATPKLCMAGVCTAQ